MNEATFNTKTSTSHLTKAGIILLVISLIFSVFCFVLGGIVLNEEDSEYDSGSKNTGYTSQNNSGSKNTGYTSQNNSGSKNTVNISSARKQLLDAYSGQTIEVEYTPSSSGTYKFYTKSATLHGVEDGSGYTKSTSYESNDRSSQYDSCYSVYLTSYETYYFEVYVSYDSPAVYIVLD